MNVVQNKDEQDNNKNGSLGFFFSSFFFRIVSAHWSFPRVWVRHSYKRLPALSDASTTLPCVFQSCDFSVNKLGRGKNAQLTYVRQTHFDIASFRCFPQSNDFLLLSLRKKKL